MSQTQAHLAYVFDADAGNFETLVLQNSHKGPVLVNFWSPRVGPCLRAWNVLQELVNEYEGRLLLVNVNTDKQSDLARHCNVISLPLVQLYHGASVVGQVRGAQGLQEYRSLIDTCVQRPSDALILEAVKLYQQGEKSQAYEMLTKVAEGDSRNPRILRTRAKLLMLDCDYHAVTKLVDAADIVLLTDSELCNLYTHAEFIVAAQSAPSRKQLFERIKEQPKELENYFLLAAQALVENDFEGALDMLLRLAHSEREFRSDIGFRGLMAIFNILGAGHELVRKYQSEMQAPESNT